MKKIPEDGILEILSKMRLRDSEQLKSTLALYTEDTVLQKKKNPAFLDWKI